jgi:hypothetical protein
MNENENKPAGIKINSNPENLDFAKAVRRHMRRKGVTIRELAASMGVTMKRVREVRDTGKAPRVGCSGLWMADWVAGINCAAADKATAAKETETLAAHLDAGWDAEQRQERAGASNP